jgi:zinc ribbon protein
MFSVNITISSGANALECKGMEVNMFCLYCGTKLPEDAIFCNKCGKRQKPTENEAGTDIAILPFPMVPNVPTGGGQSTAGNVPMVQGTPSLANRPSTQPFVHSAGNAASPISSTQIPPQFPSSASLAPTPHAVQHQIEPSTSPAHYSRVGGRGIPSDGLRLAGKLSRRAVVGGLVGATGLVVVGGGLTWLAVSRNQRASSSASASLPVGAISLGYSTNLDQWGINYYPPSAITLSTTPPDSSWTLPLGRGIQRLFGSLTFGDKNTRVGVIVDRLSDISAGNPYYSAEVVFNFDGGTDFSNQPTYQVNGNGSQAIEFTIVYSNGSHQKFAISVYTAAVNNDYGFNYYRACVRQGTAKLGGVDYPIAITSENNDGVYSNLDAVAVTLDLNGDGKFEDNEHLPANKPFVLKGTSYVIQSIAPDGSYMTIVPSS